MLENRLNHERTYFETRREIAAERAAMVAQRPHATPEQVTEFNRARLPNRLSPGEWDPAHGVFGRPPSLTHEAFSEDREGLEALFAAREADPHGAGLGSENYREIKRHVALMSDHLHAQIEEISADEYIGASKFLKSLDYEARSAPEILRFVFLPIQKQVRLGCRDEPDECRQHDAVSAAGNFVRRAGGGPPCD